MSREIIYQLTRIVTTNEQDQRTIDAAGRTIFALSKRIQSQANQIKQLHTAFQRTKERQEKRNAQWEDAVKLRDAQIKELAARINHCNKRLVNLGEDDDIVWIDSKGAWGYE